MTDSAPLRRPPLTLVVNSHEWHLRSLESILGPHGYAVLRAYNGKQAVERAISAHPDLIIIDADLPDRDGLEVCRELRALPNVSAYTPILITSAGQQSRQKRIEALRAGAWDFIGASFDGEELPLRLDAFVRAKQETDRIREESLLDDLTGLYNLRGLARRARELGSSAFRQREAFACLVIAPLRGDAPDNASTEEWETATLTRLAKVLLRLGRTSDAIGTLGPGEFAIVAQGTDPAGAEKFAERLASAASELFGSEGIQLAVGYDAVPNYNDAPIDPSDMLTRATAAMRASRTVSATTRRSSIRRFEASLN